MGSGAQTARETVRHLVAAGERVGAVSVRLYRPFPTAELLAALPGSARRIAVLDRTKEPGSLGEPLFLDVVAALAEAGAGDGRPMPLVTGGRYGLSSKEFTPGMVAGVLRELAAEAPRRRFTVGIDDDVTGLSIPWDRDLDIEPPDTLRAVFFGLGSDGTVGANTNTNTIKILGGENLHAQGYFVHDSKKSGSQTVSHLRFGRSPIRAPYLVAQAGFVGCHHAGLLARDEVMDRAAPGATLLLNTPAGAAEVWDTLPRRVQEQVLAKHVQLFVLDADRVAAEAGLPGRVNTALQTCFFALSGVLPHETAVARIRAAVEKSYGRQGADVVAANLASVDRALRAWPGSRCRGG